MYSAASVISALKSNEALIIDGDDKVGCPSEHEGCTGDLQKCNVCKNHSCKQRISIHHNYQRLMTLSFRFVVSLQNPDGFIPKNDSALQVLVKRQFLDVNLLKEAV
ncbi:MAG: hypothetical protein LBH20_10445 [Treponema sp.]|jgi:hypothetical protein|nr:hypothetical protein [Treponema sp.]